MVIHLCAFSMQQLDPGRENLLSYNKDDYSSSLIAASVIELTVLVVKLTFVVPLSCVKGVVEPPVIVTPVLPTQSGPLVLVTPGAVWFALTQTFCGKLSRI